MLATPKQWLLPGRVWMCGSCFAQRMVPAEVYRKLQLGQALSPAEFRHLQHECALASAGRSR